MIRKITLAVAASCLSLSPALAFAPRDCQPVIVGGDHQLGPVALMHDLLQFGTQGLHLFLHVAVRV